MERYLITNCEDYGREPILRKMRDGTLVCLFLTGGPYEPHNENVVKIAKSMDDGATWSEPEVLFSHSSRGCWSTELFTECDKPFAIVQTYNAPAHYRELQTFRSFCNENGSLWNEPISIPGTINGCSVRQGIVLSNGDILFPVYWQEVRHNFAWDSQAEKSWDTDSWPFISGVCISSDGGQSFSRYGHFEFGNATWEPNAIEVEPGHIILYARSSKGYLVMTESYDYGRTWCEPTLSNIPNPDTKVTLLKIKDTILMVNNFNDTIGFKMNARNNLAIAKSKDGKNFERILDVEAPDELWFYPHGFIDVEKEILYLAYENKNQHVLKKFSFEELGIK